MVALPLPPKKICLHEIPRNHKCYLIWQKGLYRCNQVKDLEMRSSLST